MLGPAVGAALASSPLLRGLPEERLGRIAAVARRRAYRRGEVICHQGDPGDTFHVIESGRLKVSLYGESGAETLLAILGPSECFGELALLDGEPRSATVQALEPVETIVVRRSDFLALLRQNPAIMDRLLVAMAAKIRYLSDVVSDLAFLDLEGRLAKRLLELAEEHGRPVDSTTEIELPITQEDLAAMVGSTRASVNKLLGWYEDRGLIRRRGRRIALLDPERLRNRIT